MVALSFLKVCAKALRGCKNSGVVRMLEVKVKRIFEDLVRAEVSRFCPSDEPNHEETVADYAKRVEAWCVSEHYAANVPFDQLVDSIKKPGGFKVDGHGNVCLSYD